MYIHVNLYFIANDKFTLFVLNNLKYLTFFHGYYGRYSMRPNGLLSFKIKAFYFYLFIMYVREINREFYK